MTDDKQARVMDEKKFNKLWNEWLKIAKDEYSESTVSMMVMDHPGLFYAAAEQNEPEPKGTIYNDDFLFDMLEFVEHWLEFLRSNDGR